MDNLLVQMKNEKEDQGTKRMYVFLFQFFKKHVRSRDTNYCWRQSSLTWPDRFFSHGANQLKIISTCSKKDLVQFASASHSQHLYPCAQ